MQDVKTKLLYGFGAFGYGSVGNTIGSFLMFYASSVLGIPGTLMGIAFSLSTVWDATTDPFVGYFSDNTKSKRFGRRHGWILFGALAVAVCNLLLWSIPTSLSATGKFWLLLCLLLLIETANTCYSTPYGALGLDLSKSYDDRTATQNFKTACSFCSLLIPSVLMSIFLGDSKSGDGYFLIACVTSCLCVLCAVICFIGTYKHRSIAKDIKKESLSSIFGDFFSIIKQKNVGRLVAGYAVSLFAGAFLTGLGLHVFTYTFQFSNLQISVIMSCIIFGIIAGQPIWYFVSKKIDKVNALKYALLLLISCMAVFAIVLIFRKSIPQTAGLVYVCAAIFTSGIATGCLYSLPMSMYADCVDVHNQRTGVDNTGRYAGFLTFCTKISNAVILFIIGVSLDIIGFRGGHATQSLFVQNMLGILLISGVALSATVAFIVYGRYSYVKSDFEN